MDNLKKLSRNELKRVEGGLMHPTGDYVCCWAGTNNCSTPVHHDQRSGGDLSCVEGAELKWV